MVGNWQIHPKVFLSASADWTVKLWDHNSGKPVISFDLNNSVGDVCWAPYSATTFAAVTSDGKVHVYDLNENKHEPMCEQKIVRKAKLTKVRPSSSCTWRVVAVAETSEWPVSSAALWGCRWYSTPSIR